MDARHPASEKKRRRLRLEGDVAPVSDLVPVGLALGGVLAWFLVGPRLVGCLARVMAAVLADPGTQGLARAAAPLRDAGLWTLAAAALLVLGALLPAWAASGFLWSPARLFPGLGWRLATRPVAAGRHLAMAGLSLLALLVVSPAAAQLAREAAPQAAAGLGARWLLLAGGAGAALVVLAGLASAATERIRYESRIRMSEEEKRREVLEDQGHPAVRRARDMLADKALSLDAPGHGGGAAAGMVDMERPGNLRSVGGRG